MEYYNPKAVFDKFGPFDYDPATTKEIAEKDGIPNYDTEETDGLKRDWSHFNKIWINPPFTKKFEFLKKAIDTLEGVRGISFYFLLPISALATKKFHEIMNGTQYHLFIPDGRIKFESADGTSTSPAFGSVIIFFNGLIDSGAVKHWRMDG